MNTLIIEINDFELTLIQGDTHVSQLGVALIKAGEVVFGEQAWQEGQASPLNVYNHYWQRLGYEEVKTDNTKVNNFADLAFLQLQHLTVGFYTCPHIIFVVPPYYNNEQLALLLGIAKTCELSVSAIINNAIAYLGGLSFNYKKQPALLVDIELHQTTCTELTANNMLNVEQSQVIANQGIHDLYHEIAKWINQKLINECRFDGFYCAETEQEIYQYIPTLLRLDTEQYNIRVSDKNIVIYLNNVKEKIDQFFETTLNNLPSGSQCFITRRFANLLERITVAADHNFIVVDHHSLTRSLHNHFDLLTNSNDITLIKKVPLNTEKASDIETQCHLNNYKESKPHKTVNKMSVITHVLIRGCAYPLITENSGGGTSKYYLSEEPPYLSVEETNQSNVVLVHNNAVLRIEKPQNSSCIYINNLPVKLVQNLAVGDTLTSSIFKHPINFIHVNDSNKQGKLNDGS